MKLGQLGLGSAPRISPFIIALFITPIFVTASHANVTAVYGCRFYVDGKVYAEFRINEINHTDWAERGTYDPPEGKPIEVKVEAEGALGGPQGLRFRLPAREVEIEIANTLSFVNARYSSPALREVPGECEQADNRNALNRWFIEREKQRKK